jgi:hypothetical protein
LIDSAGQLESDNICFTLWNLCIRDKYLVMKVSDALQMMRSKKNNTVLVEPRDDSDVYGIMTL